MIDNHIKYDISDVYLYRDLKHPKNLYSSEISKDEERLSDKSSIFNWNNQIIKPQELFHDLTGIFYDCSSLLFLPDLSKMKANNFMFIHFLHL